MRCMQHLDTDRPSLYGACYQVELKVLKYDRSLSRIAQTSPNSFELTKLNFHRYSASRGKKGEGKGTS